MELTAILVCQGFVASLLRVLHDPRVGEGLVRQAQSGWWLVGAFGKLSGAQQMRTTEPCRSLLAGKMTATPHTHTHTLSLSHTLSLDLDLFVFWGLKRWAQVQENQKV